MISDDLSKEFLLQYEIEQKVQSIKQRMLQKIFEIKKGVNKSLEQNGEHFQHLL